MKKEIILLTDYKNCIGSKYNAVPYRSGMNKKLLSDYFHSSGFNVNFINFSRINLRNDNFNNKIVLYTSSEDKGDYYKSYIEDICYGLKLQGAILIPHYVYLRAHNNKVFMEILRDLFKCSLIKNNESSYFGTLEEFYKEHDFNNIKTIIKSASGAMSKGVASGENKITLLRKTSKISNTKYFVDDLRDYVRSLRHKGYIKNSTYRKKFIIQNLIPDLKNDWKILVYNNKYYALYRGIRKNDFRASGSGKFIFKKEVPLQVLNFAELLYNFFNVPNLSLDIGFDGNQCYLFEFQAVYFGTTTIEKSPFYFTKSGEKWDNIIDKSELEREYVDSVVQFIKEERYKIELRI